MSKLTTVLLVLILLSMAGIAAMMWHTKREVDRARQEIEATLNNANEKVDSVHDAVTSTTAILVNEGTQTLSAVRMATIDFKDSVSSRVKNRDNSTSKSLTSFVRGKLGA